LRRLILMEEYYPGTDKIELTSLSVKQHLDNLARLQLINKLCDAKRFLDPIFVSKIKDEDYVKLLRLIDSLLIEITNLK